MAIYHIFGGASEKVLIGLPLFSPAIYTFFFSFSDVSIFVLCRNIHRVPPHCTLSSMQNPVLRSKLRKRYAWSHASLYFAILVQHCSFFVKQTIHFFVFNLCCTFLPSKQSSSNTLHYIHIEQLDKVSSPSFHLPSLWNS